MQTYNVTFSRSYVIVLILVLMPLMVVAVFLSLLMQFDGLPDWAVLLVSFSMIGVSLGAVLLTLKKWGTVPATVDMDREGLYIRLMRWSPFYPRREYRSPWDGLSNVSSNFDPQHGRRFYLISFKQPAATVSIDPGTAATADSETPLGQGLLDFVERYNSAHTSAPETLIRRRGFYDAWWAKSLTALTYAGTVGVLIGFFVNREMFPVWRVLQVLAFSAGWLAAFYANRRHSNGS